MASSWSGRLAPSSTLLTERLASTQATATYNAQGLSVSGKDRVTRRIVELRSRVRPGDSGAKLGTRDLITDFDQAEGDQLELYFFDSLEFIGTAAFSAANQVRYAQSGGSTFVQISTDLDATAESIIELRFTPGIQAYAFTFG